MQRQLLFALPFAFIMGCGAMDNADDSAQQVDDPVSKEDSASKPLGTYNITTSSVGAPTLIVLRSDGVYHIETLVECFMAPCNPLLDDGLYKFTKKGTQTFVTDKNSKANLFEYKMASGGKLSVRNTVVTKWLTATHEIEHPWCDEDTDCAVQGMSPSCQGAWDCYDNSCSFTCAPNACQAAGGSCVALVLGACANGKVGNATKYSCGGGLGVECCLPKTTTNACEAAGGSCVALVLGACANGKVGNATKYSCGGGLGVECCLPKTTTNACEAAGGSCVALYPGNCNNGKVGDATKYSCGGGLGVECCLSK